jgi:autotransporter-associated beta strand protein
MSRSKRNLAAAALASAIAALGLRSTPALAYITVGDWENNNSEGWFDWYASGAGVGDGDYNPGADPTDFLPSSIYSFSTEGATLGTSSLAMDQPTGFYQPLALKTEFETDSEGNSEKTDIVNNSEFAINLTYNSAEWTGTGINTHLNLTLNFGYVDSTGNHSFGGSINGGAVDTGNPGNVGAWDPVDYKGVTTRTITYNYSSYLSQMQSIYNTYTAPGDATYFELYYSTYEVGQGPIYFDNARFTSPQITATWSNQAGLNGDGTWHWGSTSNWTGGMPSNPGDIVNFGTAIPGPETIDLDGNEEFQVSVGTMNFSTGASYTIAQGTGGSLTLNGNIDNPDGSITAGTAQVNAEYGSHFITAPVILATNTTIAVARSIDTMSISGNISGPGAITIDSTPNSSNNGTVKLSGNNSYAGGTSVNTGTLQVGSANALGFGGVVTATSAATFPVATVNSGGTLDLNGQTLNKTITLNGGTLTNSNGSATAGLATGVVNGYVVASGGSGLSATLTNGVTGGGGSGAGFNVLLGLTQNSINAVTQGATPSYTLPPAVTISGGGGTGATASSNISGGTVTITLTNPGIGYTSAPTITLAGGVPVGTTSANVASVTANANNFTAVGVQALLPGSGYTSAPIATSTPVGGSSPVAPTITAFLNTLNVEASSTINGPGAFAIGSAVNGAAASGTATLTLDGTSASNSISGVIGNGTAGGNLALAKSNSSVWTLSGANTYNGGTTVSAGTLLIDPTSTPKTTSALGAGSASITGGLLQLAPGVTGGNGPAVSSSVNLTSLSITGNGQFDVNNNHIIITYGATDPFSTIANYIKSGYNSGHWNGPGIMSTAALTKTNGLSYGVGYADGKDGKVSGLVSGQIEVAYTLLGDANLDGIVNATDFTILAANFNQPVTGWDQGDFNYDGLVNATDFTDLAANFNQPDSGAASAGDVAALDAFAAANGLSLPTSSVPEPASMGLLTLGAVGVLARRRRST